MLLVLLLSGCGGGGSVAAGTATAGDALVADDGDAAGVADDMTGGIDGSGGTDASIRVQWFPINDPFANGMEALKLLVPTGWNVRDGVQWNIGLRNGGVTRNYSVNSPDGLYGFEFVPTLPHYWDDVIGSQFPIGSVYGIAGAEIRPPLNALDYISQIVLPGLPYDGVTTLQFEQMPAVAAALRDGLYQGPADAARARIAFRANGIDFEGEVHAWLSYLPVEAAPLGLTNTWLAERVFLIYAPRGEIDATSAQLYPLVVSEVINPAWVQVPLYVERLRIEGNAQLLAQNAEFAEFLRQSSEETFDLITQTFRDANLANDAIFDSYSQYLRGVDTWQDPTVGPVELPSGFDQVWSNPATGEYLLLNDPLFNPNSALTGNWAQLNRG